MFKLMLVMLVLGINISFGQINGIDGFKKLGDGFYISTVKDIRQAIYKYNYLLSSNNMDTLYVYNVVENPIDFGYIVKDDKVIVTFLLKNGKKYDLLAKEIDNEDTFFFDVVDKGGEIVGLKYKRE